jgi:hypothetical protein
MDQRATIECRVSAKVRLCHPKSARAFHLCASQLQAQLSREGAWMRSRDRDAVPDRAWHGHCDEPARQADPSISQTKLEDAIESLPLVPDERACESRARPIRG